MNNRNSTSSLVKVLLILTPFLFLNCGGEPDVKEVEVEKDGLQSYKLDIRQDKIPIADLIQSIEITRLEETEESLLKGVSQVDFYEEKMIMLSNETFYFYSKAGEFLSKFNRKGDGPEEYSRLTDIWFEDGIVSVYSINGMYVNRYDLEGNFISRDRLGERAAHVYPYKSGYVLDMHIIYTQDTLKYSLVTVDDQMKLDKTFLPFEKHPGFRGAQFRSSFFTVNDDLLYLHTMSDTVYRLTTDSVVPYIHYDFQDDWYFKPGVEVKRDFSEEQRRKKQVWFVLNHIGQDYIFLYTTLGPRMDYDFFIDRKTKQSISIDWRISNIGKLDFYALDWNRDEFLISLRSSHLTDLLDQLDQEQYSFTEGTTLEEIGSSENPVLIRMKLKQAQGWN